jgi:hypothetical protein
MDILETLDISPANLCLWGWSDRGGRNRERILLWLPIRECNYRAGRDLETV